MSAETVMHLDAIVARSVQARRAVSRLPRSARAGWLRAIADALDAEGAGLVRLAGRETNLPPERLRGEIARTTGQLRMFAGVVADGAAFEPMIDHAVDTATPPTPDLRRLLVPIGTVAVYAASNFPFAFSVAGGDTASALAAGCAVIVKAHPGHPETSRRTAEIVERTLVAAGAPSGLFAMIEGFEAGRELVAHPRVDGAAFTGSLAGGRALADAAASRPRPIPFFGELGSLNPVVVTPGADADRGDELAAGLAASFTLGVGQFCTKPGLVLVPRDARLTARLPEHVPAELGPMLHDGIAEAYARGTERLDAHAEAFVRGAGQTAPLVARVDAKRAVETPEIFDEVFGPATVLVEYDGLAELRAVVEVLPGSLTGTVHADQDEDVSWLVEALAERVGRLVFDGWPTGVAVTPAQHHGGPWPATNSQHTSVGGTAIRRFLRPIAYQSAPERYLPTELRDPVSA